MTNLSSNSVTAVQGVNSPALPPSPEATSPLGGLSNNKIPARFCHVADAGLGPSRSSPSLGGWGHLKNVIRKSNDHWIGDVLGALSIFAAGYLLLVFGWALS